MNYKILAITGPDDRLIVAEFLHEEAAQACFDTLRKFYASPLMIETPECRYTLDSDDIGNQVKDLCRPWT